MKNKSQQFPKQFENIQFPISHLEAENPFGLVFREMIWTCYCKFTEYFDQKVKSTERG